MHYSQQEPGFDTTVDGDVLVAVGRGLLSAGMLREVLTNWETDFPEALPPKMLFDLSEVAGYGAGCASLARDWLGGADVRGVRRIAFVGASAVLRTATRLIAGGVKAELRIFSHSDKARRWLDRPARARKAGPPAARA